MSQQIRIDFEPPFHHFVDDKQEEEIEEAEVVDERPKAKWSTIIKQKDWLITETRQCNRCSYEPPLEEVKNFKFCPWCGARME